MKETRLQGLKHKNRKIQGLTGGFSKAQRTDLVKRVKLGGLNIKTGISLELKQNKKRVLTSAPACVAQVRSRSRGAAVANGQLAGSGRWQRLDAALARGAQGLGEGWLGTARLAAMKAGGGAGGAGANGAEAGLVGAFVARVTWYDQRRQGLDRRAGTRTRCTAAVRFGTATTKGRAARGPNRQRRGRLWVGEDIGCLVLLQG